MSTLFLIFIILSAVAILLFMVLKLKISAFIALLITSIYVGIMRPNVYFVNSQWVYIGIISDLWAHEKSPAPIRTGLSQVEAVNQFNHPRACPVKP